MSTLTLRLRRTSGRICAGLCLAAWLGPTPPVEAAPPVNPLEPPIFSFDLESPSVGLGYVSAGDLLSLVGDEAATVILAEQLQLYSPADDLDGLSTSHAWLLPGQLFVLLFSVNRASESLVPPDPELITLGLPFNATDQAMRGHAAGDQFMSTVLFTRGGRMERGQRAVNNVLVRNNYDEGGTDFGAVPRVDAYGNPVPNPAPALPHMAPHNPLAEWPLRLLQDNVDATCLFPSNGTGWEIMDVYFTLSAGSPSLYELPGSFSPSGANIFFNPHPAAYAQTGLYAPHGALGLLPEDDIDALLVFDINADGFFNGNDRVIFSLTYESPSLLSIPGASTQGAAADLFIAAPDYPPMLFTPAASLGLTHPADNVDALDLAECVDPYACAADFGIRALKGDLNCDGYVNFGDINPFVLALSNPIQYKNLYPGCFIQNGDINADGSTDFADINPFVAILSGGGH